MRPTGSPVGFSFDGREIEALEGETIAAALAASDIVAVRQARSGAPRGPFCGMGVCFDCLVTVDGRPSQRACLTKVAAGMDVRSSPTAGAAPAEPAPTAEEIACDVLVVGAGPAGLSAARALAAGRRRRGRARRAAPPGRPVLQAAGALAPGRDLDPRQPVPRRCGADAIDAAGRRAHRQRGDGVGGLLSPRGRRHRRRPVDALSAQAAGAGDRRLRAVADDPRLDLARRDDRGRLADAGALLPRGAGRAHRDRGQRPALPADRRRASGRRRQRRGRARGGAAARAGADGSAGKRCRCRSLPDGRWPLARCAARQQAALGAPGDAARGRRSRARHRGRRPALRRRHRGAELRLRLVVGAGARAGLRPSLRAARQRLDGDADRRQRPHQPRRGLRHRRRRALRRRARRDGCRACWPPPPSRPISA